MYHDDDDDFPPAINTNLAAVFTGTLLESANTSLSYVAPKQPKKKHPDSVKQKAEESAKTTVIYAKPITLYKIIANLYSLIGKYGLALIGNEDISLYEIIIYKDKQNILIRMKLTPNFNIIIQSEVHVTMKDNSNQLWTFKFDDNKDLNNMILELQKRNCKVNIQKKLTNMNISTKCDVVNNNNSPTGNVMKMNNNVTEDATTIENPPASESTQSDNKTKADILSRIVKMGQRTLLTSRDDCVETESSTSEVSASEEVSSNETKMEITKTSKNTNNSLKLVTQETEKTNQIENMYHPNELFLSQYLHTYSAEQRIQNAEIRMHLNQLSTKLDSLDLNTYKFKSKDEDVLKERIEKLETKLAAYELETSEKNRVKESHEKLANKVDALIDSHNSLQNDIANLHKEVLNKNIITIRDVIKDLMNDLYVHVCANFTKESYSCEEVKKEIAKTIKGETLKLIAKLENTLYKEM